MKKYIWAVLLLAIISQGTFARGNDESYPEGFTLKVTALNGPTGIGMIHLFEDNPYLGEGISTEYTVAPQPKALMGDLAKEEPHMAVLPANMPALLHARGLGYKVAAVTGLGTLYIVSTDESIQSLEDLNGKTLYNAAKGATPDFMTRILLSGLNIDPDNDLLMDFSYGPADLAKAMIGGLVETAVLPEPFVTMVTSKSQARVAVDLQEEWKKQMDADTAYPMSVIVVRDDIAENYPQLIDSFLDEYEKSINRVNQNPSESASLIPEHGFTLPAAVAEKAIPRINLKYIDGQRTKDILGDYYQVLFETDPKIIGGSLPGDELYYIEK